MGILEWRNKIHEIKNSLGRLNSRSKTAKETVSKIECRSVEIIQSEQQWEIWLKKFKKIP